jgi:hypothetical protein
MRSTLTRIWRWLSRSSAPTPGIDRIYFGLATEYYAAARGAVFAGSHTVPGNLFHHAIELYLKGVLSADLPQSGLSKYRHDLKRLWKDYKRKNPSSDLSVFDATINALHKFEAIRYPDAIAAKGMFYALPISRPDPPLTFSVASGSTPPTYFLVVNEVDALVRAIFDTASVNPTFHFNQLGEEGRAVIQRNNPSF